MKIHIHYDYHQLSIAGVTKWQVPGGWEVQVGVDRIWAQLLLYINLTSHRGRTNKRGSQLFRWRQLLLYINLTSHRGRTNKRGSQLFRWRQLLLYINPYYHHCDENGWRVVSSVTRWRQLGPSKKVAARPSSTIRNLFCLQTCCCILFSYVVSKKKVWWIFSSSRIWPLLSQLNNEDQKSVKGIFSSCSHFEKWRRCIFVPRSTNPSKAPRKGLQPKSIYGHPVW